MTYSGWRRHLLGFTNADLERDFLHFFAGASRIFRCNPNSAWKCFAGGTELLVVSMSPMLLFVRLSFSCRSSGHLKPSTLLIHSRLIYLFSCPDFASLTVAVLHDLATYLGTSWCRGSIPAGCAFLGVVHSTVTSAAVLGCTQSAQPSCRPLACARSFCCTTCCSGPEEALLVTPDCTTQQVQSSSVLASLGPCITVPLVYCLVPRLVYLLGLNWPANPLL